MNYATSADAPADKEGWLWKRGDVNKAFQKRYFVLKGNLVNKLSHGCPQEYFGEEGKYKKATRTP